MSLLPLKKRKSFLNFPEAIPNLIPLRRYLTNLEVTYMQFQEALVFAMQDSNVDEQELTARTGSNPRWITEITTNPDWRPKLDTILRLCHALRFNVLTFLDYAESGSRGEASIGGCGGISVEKQMNLILAVMPCHVAKTLRVLRQECGLSQGKLEEMTPFSKSTISLREGHRNRNYPTTTTLSIYCEAYGIKLTEFVSRLFLVTQAETKLVMHTYFETYPYRY